MVKGGEKSDSNKVILVTGGARSGKSRFAEQYAANLSEDLEGEKIYLATSEIFDEEMRQRVEQHQQQRSLEWRTIEEPVQIETVFRKLSREKVSFVLMDCLTLWVSNLCLQRDEEGEEVWMNPEFPPQLLKRVERFAQLIKEVPFTTILVTNEVGASIVPEYPLGRVYRDLMGHINQLIASYSDDVFFVVCGFPINLRQIAPVSGKKA